ncbi:MAG: tRNA 2-selenouridine(34) synthase MnmH [Chitinophagaceae bacterium]|nr:tRNA 2-selenouridine(34) synthase MnmH [Chitinophagaceae bacterium]
MTVRLHIQEFLEQSKNNLVIDVRSPAEYNRAHIPGAINIPLFTDEERKIVGTTYKQQSREQAIKVGLDFFAPKMRKIVEEVEAITESGKSETLNGNFQIFIYCWRGGMRSAAIAWLLNLYGFKVRLLAGGYKAYRNYVLKLFEEPFQFKILGGFTGSGKTELLNELKRHGEAIIDLEALASHKGSAFGSINMPPQPSQEMFENLLAKELSIVSGPSSVIWLEDESQRIGSVNIPAAIWKNMRQSPVYFLDIPFEERLQHIAEEYSKCDVDRLIDAIERISRRLGGLETKNASNFLQEKKFTECFSILLKYYDKHYLKALHQRENNPALLNRIHADKVDASNAELLLSQSALA